MFGYLIHGGTRRPDASTSGMGGSGYGSISVVYHVRRITLCLPAPV